MEIVGLITLWLIAIVLIAYFLLAHFATGMAASGSHKVPMRINLYGVIGAVMIGWLIFR